MMGRWTHYTHKLLGTGFLENSTYVERLCYFRKFILPIIEDRAVYNVNISSQAAKGTYPGLSAYAATKSALLSHGGGNRFSHACTAK